MKLEIKIQETLKPHSYLSNVSTPFSPDKIIANIIISCLRPREQILILQFLSKQWYECLSVYLKKKRRRACLSDVSSPFTVSRIIADKIIICLQSREQILVLQFLSRKWHKRLSVYWQRKCVEQKKSLLQDEKLLTHKPWSWVPRRKLKSSIEIIFIQIQCCVEAYIKTHPQLSPLQQKHLCSRNVAREIIDGLVTIPNAAARVAPEILNKWNPEFPMLGETEGLELGIPPAMFRTEQGELFDIFGPFDVCLVEYYDVQPAMIHKLDVSEIEKLPRLQGLFSENPHLRSGNIELGTSEPCSCFGI